MLEGKFREFVQAGSLRRAEGDPSVVVRVFGEGRVRMVAHPDHCHAPPDEVDRRLAVIYCRGNCGRRRTLTSTR
jgi:hypothetical protein